MNPFVTNKSGITNPRLSRLSISLLSAIAVALIGFPLVVVIRERQSWSSATSVVGLVVETKPEGASVPEYIVFEYSMPDDSIGRAKVPIQYTTAHEVGAEQELVYRTHDPSHALTRIAARDQLFGNYSPYVLSLSWFAGLVALCTAFPKAIQPRRWFGF